MNPVCTARHSAREGELEPDSRAAVLLDAPVAAEVLDEEEAVAATALGIRRGCGVELAAGAVGNFYANVIATQVQLKRKTLARF